MTRKAVWGLGLTLGLAAAVFFGGLACRKSNSPSSSSKQNSAVTGTASLPEPSVEPYVPNYEGSYVECSSREAPRPEEILNDNSRLAVVEIPRRGNLEGRLIGYSEGDLILSGIRGIESRGKSDTATFKGDSFSFKDIRPGTYSLACKSDISQYAIEPENLTFGRREEVRTGREILTPDSDIQVRNLNCFVGGEVSIITKGDFPNSFTPALEALIQDGRPKLVLSSLAGEKPVELDIINKKFGAMVAKGIYAAKIVYSTNVGRAVISGEIELPITPLGSNYSNAEVFLVADKRPVDVSVGFASWNNIEFALLDILPHVITSRTQADSFYHTGSAFSAVPGIYIAETNFLSSGQWCGMRDVIPIFPGKEYISFSDWQRGSQLGAVSVGERLRTKDYILGQLGQSHNVHEDTFDLSFGMTNPNAYPRSLEKQIVIDRKELKYSLSSVGVDALRLNWSYDGKEGDSTISGGFDLETPAGSGGMSDVFKKLAQVQINDNLGFNLVLHKYVFHGSSQHGRQDRDRCNFRSRVGIVQSGMGATSVWCEVNTLGQYWFRTERIPGSSGD